MIPLKLTITRAGLERFTAAQLDDDLDLAISSVALTDADFLPAPTLTVLPGEFRRLATISGDQVGDNIVHMTLRDDEAIGYTARGFGLFLADGTLFAVYGQSERLFEKSSLATFLAAIDIAFPAGDVGELVFGNTDFLNPPATSDRMGVVELATLTELEAGTDSRRVAPVSVVQAILTALETRVGAAIGAAEGRVSAAVSALAGSVGAALDALASRTISGSGLVKGGGRNDANRTLTVDAATGGQVRAGAADDVAVTPAGLAALKAGFPANGEYQPVPGVIHKIQSINGPFFEGPVNIVFPAAFPTACLIVLPIGINANGSNLRDIYLQEQSVSREGCVVYVQKAGADGTSIDGLRYLAIGY